MFEGPKVLRQIMVEGENLSEATAKNLGRLLTEIAEKPEDARGVRSTYFIGFPDFDPDPRPNNAIPEIREFFAVLDQACPHICYFLVADPVLGHIQYYLRCLIPVTGAAEGYSSRSDELVAALMEHTVAAVAFAEKVGDDAKVTADDIFLSLPTQILRTIPQLSERTRDIYKERLDQCETNFLRLAWTPGGRSFVKSVMKDAADFADATCPEVPTRSALKQLISSL